MKLIRYPIYQNEDGKAPFLAWMGLIKDKVFKNRIHARLDRVRQGNFGDMKSVGFGVMELRFSFGSGY